MYTAFFGLKDNPFSITPDPGYLYLSAYHQEALAHLLYGAEENGGFVQLTGEVGTGKTTLIRTLVEQRLEKVDIALCLNPRLTVEEFVASVCDELGVAYPPASVTLKPLIDALNAHLLATHAQGRRTLLVIDEAQNLSREVLEQVRLLTNLETHRHKLLRIILVGQPELQHLLAREDMRQLAQRVTARYHLMPLNQRETSAYIDHRVRVAGGAENLFSRGALNAVFGVTQGIPRLINTVCDRALLGAYGQGVRRVTRTILQRAANEVLSGTALSRGRRRLRWSAALLAGSLVIATGLSLFSTALPTVPSVAAWLSLVEILPRPVPEAQTVQSAIDSSPGEIKEPAPPADLEAWLLQPMNDHGPLERLLALWDKAPVSSDQDPFCDQVTELGLRCLEDEAGWPALRRYNRPAVLELINDRGDSRQVLLRSLGEKTATLLIGEQSLQIDLAALDTHWTGNFLLLWRPATSVKLIGPGTTGEPVLWLRRQLARVQGLDPSATSSSRMFDATLREQVQDFQRAHGLHPDGLAGKRTLASLDSLAPMGGTPLLTDAGDEIH